MRKALPEFVLHNGGKPEDWIEAHDRLPISEASSAYHERNQQDWWRQNKRIRDLLAAKKQYVENELKLGNTLSVRMLSWSQWARELPCDRATLKHQMRYQWVNAYRNKLLALVEAAKNQIALKTQVETPKVSEVGALRIKLENQRTQTGILLEKNMGLEQRVDELNRVLARQNKKIQYLLDISRGHTPQVGN